jgi:hypothetical protein
MVDVARALPARCNLQSFAQFISRLAVAASKSPCIQTGLRYVVTLGALGAARVTGGTMPPAYHVHPEFGYFCPTPRRRRELRVAIVSILFGAIIGASIATLRVGPRSQSRWRLDGGARQCLEFREGGGGSRRSHACGDERRRHEGRGKGVHQAFSDSARAGASSRA